MNSLAAEERICTQCGATNNAQSRVCIRCGEMVAETAPPPSPFQPAPAPSAAMAAAPAPEPAIIAYDAHVIRIYARHLYNNARAITITTTLFFLLFGGGGGYLFSGDISPAIIGAIVLGAIGYWLGLGFGFRLKLQAQVALCQVKIEENTRALVERR
jgi:hypothetical protein